MTKVTINRARWRMGGDAKSLAYAFGRTALATEKGYKCCLGFAANQLFPSISVKHLKTCDMPYKIDFPSSPGRYKNIELMFDLYDEGNAVMEKNWIAEAVEINDQLDLTLPEKEQKLINLFKENDIDLEFVGNYTKIQLQALYENSITSTKRIG